MDFCFNKKDLAVKKKRTMTMVFVEMCKSMNGWETKQWNVSLVWNRIPLGTNRSKWFERRTQNWQNMARWFGQSSTRIMISHQILQCRRSLWSNEGLFPFLFSLVILFLLFGWTEPRQTHTQTRRYKPAKLRLLCFGDDDDEFEMNWISKRLQ